MHTSTLNSQWFLSQQEIVPQPSLIQLLATMFIGTAYCFVSLQCVHHWLCSYVCGLQEFSWYGFRPLTGCIKLAISALLLTEIVIIVLLQHIILYGKLYFYFYRDKGKIICALVYTVTLNVWPHKISPPTSIVMKVTADVWSTEEKHKLLKCVINRMIMLTWHIQMFRRIPIRSAMKYY